MARGIGLRTKPSVQTQASSAIDDGEVARVAYELFQRRGREDGHDLEDWLEAERIVWARRAGRARR